MYDDNNVTYRIGINWTDIIIKVILLILFVLLLVWLFPKADLDVFYDNVYNTNINTMKEAAKSYYTTDRLPSNVGDKTSMSLKEMFDNHMIIRFRDKDKNYCDETSSGVEVTKTNDNSYVLKVSLNCGEQKDFILETIGCNDVCPKGECETKEELVADNEPEETPTGGDPKNPTPDIFVTKVTLYQHKRAITSTQTVYTCPEGYTKNGILCTKTSVGATIPATPVYGEDQTIITDAKYNDGKEQTVYTDYIKTKIRTDYSCPAGYTLNGSYCIKYTDANISFEEDTYTCPTGYTKNGTKCVKTYNATYTPGATQYSCPNGGTLSGTKCTISQNASSTTNYTCPSGYTKNGTSCYKVYDAQASTNYTCPNGYTLSGTKCVTTSTETKDASKSYGSWYVTGTKYYSSTISVYTHDTKKVTFDGAVSGATCGSPCGNKGIWYKYTYYARSTSYTCPSGYTKNGSKCYKTTSSSIDATKKTTYTCPNGGTKEGNKCTLTATATPEVTYTCPSGYTKNGSKCVKTYDATGKVGAGSYSCPNGGTLNGTKCTITKDADKTPGETVYTCPVGYTLNGKTCYQKINANATDVYSYTCPTGFTKTGEGVNTKCYKVVKTNGNYYCEDANATLQGNKCMKVVKGEITNYTCPADYVLNGTECTKSTTVTIDATISTNTYTSYEYTWSEKSYIEGWIFTGNTKTIEKTYTAGQK